MVWMGNLLTSYRYRYVKLDLQQSAQVTHVRTALLDGSPTLDLTFESSENPIALPPGSPFSDWKTARRFAGPMPFTFSPGD